MLIGCLDQVAVQRLRDQTQCCSIERQCHSPASSMHLPTCRDKHNQGIGESCALRMDNLQILMVSKLAKVRPSAVLRARPTALDSGSVYSTYCRSVWAASVYFGRALIATRVGFFSSYYKERITCSNPNHQKATDHLILDAAVGVITGKDMLRKSTWQLSLQPSSSR